MKPANPILYCLAGVVALFSSIYLLNDIPGVLGKKSAGDKQSGAYFANNELKKMDAALNKTITLDTFNYIVTFESPFRKRGEDPFRSGANKKLDLSGRSKLILKGILQNSAPLAILEDEAGETYIRGIGERALDQEIFKINDNKVEIEEIKYDFTKNLNLLCVEKC